MLLVLGLMKPKISHGRENRQTTVRNRRKCVLVSALTNNGETRMTENEPLIEEKQEDQQEPVSTPAAPAGTPSKLWEIERTIPPHLH